MQTIVAKKTAQCTGDQQSNKNLGNTLWTFGIFGFLLATVLALLLLLFSRFFMGVFHFSSVEMTNVFMLYKFVLLTGIFYCPYIVCIGFLEGKHRYSLVNIIDYSMATLTALSFLVCIFLRLEVTFFVLSEVSIVLLIMGSTIFYTAAKYAEIFRYRGFYKKLLVHYKANLASLSMVRVFSILFHNSDKILIPILHSPAMLGLFELMLKIPKVIKNINSPFTQMLLPITAEETVTQENKVSSKIINYSMATSAFISVACSSGILYFSREIFTSFLKIVPTTELLLIFYFIILWCNLTPFTQIWNVYLAKTDDWKKYRRNVQFSTIVKLLVMITSYWTGLVYLGFAYVASITVQLPESFLLCKKWDVDLKSLGIILSKIISTAILMACLFSATFPVNIPGNKTELLLSLLLWGVLFCCAGGIFIFPKLGHKIWHILWEKK
jgi:O-antigen/teichoic acid export membrane protein